MVSSILAFSLAAVQPAPDSDLDRFLDLLQGRDRVVRIKEVETGRISVSSEAGDSGLLSAGVITARHQESSLSMIYVKLRAQSGPNQTWRVVQTAYASAEEAGRFADLLAEAALVVEKAAPGESVRLNSRIRMMAIDWEGPSGSLTLFPRTAEDGPGAGPTQAFLEDRTRLISVAKMINDARQKLLAPTP
ncbi:MAG: hypothetical protein MH204_10675 [Fimbriimonadaceae bacterium]|nr:hypothetical protein [Fimbriimonadaceae bacterium]